MTLKIALFLSLILQLQGRPLLDFEVAGITVPDYTCTLSDTEFCPMQNYPVGSLVQIIPGGNTKCQESSAPYSFIFRKGVSNKLLFYIQGGGACWDEMSYNANICAKTPLMQDPKGIFDDGEEKWGDYSLVVALYCSGDLFLANSTRDYYDSSGNPVEQRGVANLESVLRWTADQVQDSLSPTKYLESTLDDMVLMGVSAGAVAVPVWSDRIFSSFSAIRYGAIADSFVLFLPAPYEGMLLRDEANFCTSFLLPDTLASTCWAGVLEISDLEKWNFQQWPNVVFAYLQAKRDDVQVFFYNQVLGSVGMPAIDADTFYSRSITEMLDLNEEPNFVVFLVTATSHGYTYTARYHKADQYSDSGAVDNPGFGTSMSSWAAQVPVLPGSSLSTVCGGDDCDAELSVKTFTAAISPTSLPTTTPTVSPTSLPTRIPTQTPSPAPTLPPTSAPTAAPTPKPSPYPSMAPTYAPSVIPTHKPSSVPSVLPTFSPTNPPTFLPSISPTESPTDSPTSSPSAKPSCNPTQTPTAIPTTSPTYSPTVVPSSSPTALPTEAPTTATPTSPPSIPPTASPTFVPTAYPTTSPTYSPTSRPTLMPTAKPTHLPSQSPTGAPTLRPTPSSLVELFYSQNVAGVDVNTFLGSEDVQEGFINTVAEVLGILSSTVTITDVKTLSTSATSVAAMVKRKLVEEGVEVDYTISQTISDAGSSGSVVASLDSKLEASVSSGDFTSKLQAQGAAGLTDASSDTVSLLSTKTEYQSAAPSSAPSAESREKNDKGKTGLGKYDSAAMIAVVVMAAIFMCVALCGLCLCWRRRENAAKDDMEQVYVGNRGDDSLRKMTRESDSEDDLRPAYHVHHRTKAKGSGGEFESVPSAVSLAVEDVPLDESDDESGLAMVPRVVSKKFGGDEVYEKV